MVDGANPSIDSLLCTEKGEKVVEHALNVIDKQIFISTYTLHLPYNKQLEDFILDEMKKLGMQLQ